MVSGLQASPLKRSGVGNASMLALKGRSCLVNPAFPRKGRLRNQHRFWSQLHRASIKLPKENSLRYSSLQLESNFENIGSKPNHEIDSHNREVHFGGGFSAFGDLCAVVLERKQGTSSSLRTRFFN